MNIEDIIHTSEFEEAFSDVCVGSLAAGLAVEQMIELLNSPTEGESKGYHLTNEGISVTKIERIYPRIDSDDYNLEVEAKCKLMPKPEQIEIQISTVPLSE